MLENVEFCQQIVVDEVVVLVLCGCMKDVVKCYEVMLQMGKVLVYICVVVGDVYVYFDMLDKVVDVYVCVFKDVSFGEIEMGDVQEGLFYVMFDIGCFEEVCVLFDKMKVDNLEYVCLVLEVGMFNFDYLCIKCLEVQYLILMGCMYQGIVELDKWWYEVLFVVLFVSVCVDGVMVQIELYCLCDMYKMVFVEYLDDLSVVVGYGCVLLVVDDLKIVKNVVNGLDECFLENGLVCVLCKDLDVYQSLQFIIQLMVDKGNLVFVNNEYGIDIKVYSGLFVDYYWLFFYNFVGCVQFDGVLESCVCNGVGLQWFDIGVEVNGEVYQFVGVVGKIGGILDVMWIFSDYWKVLGMVINDDLEVFYKVYQVGVIGKSVSGNVCYIWDEMCYVLFMYGVLCYIDDNLCQCVVVNFYQQVFILLWYIIGVLFGVDISCNMMMGLNYFSLLCDYSGQVMVIWLWMFWCYVDKLFMQCVYLIGGMYNQQLFGSSLMVEVWLEYVW